MSPGRYAGLVTRALAFGLDAALLNAVALAVGAVVTLTLSVLETPGWLETAAIAAGAALYLVWVVGYFVTFWTTTGQTPGDRAFRIRVEGRNGDRIGPGAGVVRFVGLTLAALPLVAGYLLILVDDRRRGLHDYLARTVVVDGAEPRA